MWNFGVHFVSSIYLFIFLESDAVKGSSGILSGPVRRSPQRATARLRFNFVTTLCVESLLYSKEVVSSAPLTFSAAAASFSFPPHHSKQKDLFPPYRKETEFRYALLLLLLLPPLKSLDKPLLISRSVPCHCRGPVHNLFLVVFCPTLSGVRKHRAACSDICYHLMPSKLLISIKKISSGLVKQLQSLCLKGNCKSHLHNVGRLYMHISGGFLFSTFSGDVCS